MPKTQDSPKADFSFSKLKHIVASCDFPVTIYSLKMTFADFIREASTVNLNQKGRNKTHPVKCAIMYFS